MWLGLSWSGKVDHEKWGLHSETVERSACLWTTSREKGSLFTTCEIFIVTCEMFIEAVNLLTQLTTGPLGVSFLGCVELPPSVFSLGMYKARVVCVCQSLRHAHSTFALPLQALNFRLFRLLKSWCQNCLALMTTFKQCIEHPYFSTGKCALQLHWITSLICDWIWEKGPLRAILNVWTSKPRISAILYVV